jgi:hypothetical protein
LNIITPVELTERNRRRAAQEKIARMSKAQVICRARGHRWPELDPGRPLPKSYDAKPQRDGSYQVIETCERGCGKTRRTDLPGGFLEERTGYRYSQDKEWIVVHSDESPVYRSDVEAALYRMLIEKGRISA